MIITACLSSFSTGGPNKEHGTNKIQGRIIWEGPKGGRRHKPMICFANLPETFTLDSMLSGRCAFNIKGPWIRSNMGPRKMIGHRQPEKSSHYHYGELQGRAVLLGSLTFCSLPECPFPMKSFFFSPQKFYSRDPWNLILFSMFSNFSLFRQCSIYKRLNIDINGIKYCSELGTHMYDQLGFNKGSRQFNG